MTVDYLSGFWEVDQLSSTTSSATIRCLKRHLGRYGIPNCLRSDNGPQFSSEEFKQFCKEWGIKHVTSSPVYPASNGKAESAVKVAKEIIMKARKTKEDPWKMILEYRNIPTAGLNSSPVQRFFGRQTRTALPVKQDKLLANSATDSEEIKELLKRRQETQKKYYDQHATELPPLQPGEVVRVQPTDQGAHSWKKARVEKCVAQRSYEILTEEGQRLRRNRRHLRRSPRETFEGWEELPLPTGSDYEEETEEERNDREEEEETEEEIGGREEQQKTVKTKSGRMVRKPRWLSDYET